MASQACCNINCLEREITLNSSLKILDSDRRLTMEEPALKKQKLESITDKKDEWDPVIPPSDDENGGKYTKETDVGITEFIDQEYEGFECILKYKYVSSVSANIDILISW
jgi:hypothetical protein